MPQDALFFQKKLITHCAPTLSALKVGNLFILKKCDYCNYQDCIRYFNNILKDYSLYINVLRNDKNSMLIYVYNLKRLTILLKQKNVREFLNKYGYPLNSIPETLGILKHKMLDNEFPHEIGIFLGYPLSDINAFINDQKVKEIGYWKVYSNVKNAKKTFYKYDCCKKMFINQISSGKSLESLMSHCYY